MGGYNFDFTQRVIALALLPSGFEGYGYTITPFFIDKNKIYIFM